MGQDWGPIVPPEIGVSSHLVLPAASSVLANTLSHLDYPNCSSIL